MLVSHKYPIIVGNNKLAMTDSNRVIQTPQALKTSTMQELIKNTTMYSMMNVSSTLWIIIRTGINGSTPDSSDSRTSDVATCINTTPPFVCICNGIIMNIGQIVTGTTPPIRGTSELQASVDRRFSNDSNVISFISQILCDEFSVSSGTNLN